LKYLKLASLTVLTISRNRKKTGIFFTSTIWLSVLGLHVFLFQAQDFRQQGTKMRRKMWLQNMKIKLIVLGIIIALILVIVLSVCHGFNCGHK